MVIFAVTSFLNGPLDRRFVLYEYKGETKLTPLLRRKQGILFGRKFFQSKTSGEFIFMSDLSGFLADLGQFYCFLLPLIIVHWSTNQQNSWHVPKGRQAERGFLLKPYILNFNGNSIVKSQILTGRPLWIIIVAMVETV